jgi:voltage-gated potassium channel
MSEPRPASPEERWESAAQLPLLLASVLFVVAYAWPILDPGLPPAVRSACTLVVWGTWIVLVGELAVRFWLAERKWTFIRKHPLDLAAAVLPVLRSLQLLRLLTLLNVLNRYAGSSLRGRVGAYLVGSVTLIVFMASLAILDAERGGRGPIQGFGDALWWALATITTVGYGDMYPVTTEGRFIAVGLMFCGIGVLGVVTASFASWLVERVEDIEDDLEEGSSDVLALREEIVALRRALEHSGMLHGSEDAGVSPGVTPDAGDAASRR